MAKKIRCAVLGLGRLGYWHAENLSQRVRGGELIAVADPMEGRAEQVARDLGVPKWHQNPDDVFEDCGIDAVVIVTPTSTHADMIKKAVAHGKHVFVEKPITRTVEEAEEVIKAIDDRGVFCQVGFMRRFDPSYVEAKRRILAGDIGKPIYFKGITRDGIAPPPDFIKHSGGLYLDFSIHDYDSARFFLGGNVTTVSGLGSVVEKKYVAEFNDVDQALTYLTFDSGAAADIEASRNAAYGYDIRAEIIGTEGAIQIGSMQHHDIKILAKNRSSYDIYPDFPSQFRDAYLMEMVSFIEHLQNDEKPNVNEVDGKIALEIAIAATKSYQTGTEIQLEPVKAV
ncbi:Gfo/Idh/MocA family oxidoreductase [Melghirimyces algeriensis]|uniref:Myo-inositol 2-dehydrogenase n=1 Tax=Melghirimyces algeriensis TaxID=910412 RepID=A0A521B370_9BACL|nr:Gfo/Idh/MocA family oxidoreductase [Melghirimyces algeriensis]SMO41499.1 myo-inositol 2-dehydrogenase [Melghirimyces algeriensis]